MKLKYDYHLEEFRHAFELYLKRTHPNWNDKSIKTRASDAFILFRWYSEEEAWRITIEDGHHIEKYREEIEDMLMNRKNYKKDATGYITAIKELQLFVELVSLVEKARKLRPRNIQLSFDLDFDDSYEE